MKKIVITVFAVTTAAVAVHAQGVARDFNTFAEYAPTIIFGSADTQSGSSTNKNLQAAMKKVEREIQKQHIAFLRAEQEKAEQAQKPTNASAQAAQPVGKAAKSEGTQAQVPSYYYGREGKLLALSDKTAEVIKENSTETKQANTQSATSKKETTVKKEEKEEKVSFWRYLLPGRLPNESWESYNNRMSYAANQPFK